LAACIAPVLEGHIMIFITQKCKCTDAVACAFHYVAVPMHAELHGGVVQLLKYLVANGSMEYKSAKEEKGILHGDEKELEEPLLANLLHGKVYFPHQHSSTGFQAGKYLAGLLSSVVAK